MSEVVVSEDEEEETILFADEPQLEQPVARSGLSVSKKGWAVRIALLFALIFLMCYNMVIALQLSDPLIVYSTLMPIQTLSIFFIGWFFFRNLSKGKKLDYQELVSVVIPIYNQKALIDEVVDAVFKSSYNHIEVIAVDDGSNDGTSEVLDCLKTKYPELTVIHQANAGKRRAVSTGFYASRGKYVVLIDSDSIVNKYAIEEFVKTFQSNYDVGAVVGNGNVLNSNKNFLTKCQDAWYDYAFNIHKTTESVFGTVLCCSGCLAAYRREAIAPFIPYWVGKTKVQKSEDKNQLLHTFWNLAPHNDQCSNSKNSVYSANQDKEKSCKSKDKIWVVCIKNNPFN